MRQLHPIVSKLKQLQAIQVKLKRHHHENILEIFTDERNQQNGDKVKSLSVELSHIHPKQTEKKREKFHFKLSIFGNKDEETERNLENH